MASTRKSPPGDALDRAARALAGRLSAGTRVAVGLSGGLDSTVLLDVAARLAAKRGWTLRAIHVHHGLSPNADRWAASCAALCAARGVPLDVERVEVKNAGSGLEAAARAARYAVYARVDADVLLLAHHAGDQAETLLLNLARGAGVEGAAGIAGERALEGTAARVVRPFLDLPRAALAAYAAERGLEWIEDESNADPRHARNAIRHRVMPALEAIHPGATLGLARSARLAAESAVLVHALAEMDARAAARDAGWSVEALAARGEARARAALRWILDSRGVRAPTAARLHELWRQLARAADDATVAVKVREAIVRRYRGLLYVTAPHAVPAAAIAWDGSEPWPLPAFGGVMTFERGPSGLELACLVPARVSVRPRSGGERFRPAGERHHRTLKNLFQERAVPPWTRRGLPLVYVDDVLAWVPGVGPAAPFAVAPGAPGWVVRWVASAGPATDENSVKIES